MRIDCLGQKGQEMTVVLGTTRADGQHSLNKAAACRAARAETALAPQHCRSQGSFRRVIGRLDTLGGHKHPQSLPERQKLPAQSADAMPPDLLPVLQSLAYRSLYWDQCRLQSRAVKLAFPIAIPMLKHRIDLIEHLTCPPAVWVSVVGYRRQVSGKVRPADLPQSGIAPVVGGMPIRAEYTSVVRANETLQTLALAIECEQKDRCNRADSHPKPGLLERFFPAGFIDVDDLLVLLHCCKRVVDWSKRVCGSLTAAHDTPDTERQATYVEQRLRGCTFTQTQATMEEAGQRSGTRTVAARSGILGARAWSKGTTSRTTDGVLLVFRNVRKDWRYLPDLSAKDTTDIWEGLGQGFLTARTLFGVARNDFLDVQFVQEWTRMTLVPWLSAGLSTARGAFWA